MLLVKTKIDKSTIPGAGLGLFADEFIPKGTRIFEEDNLSIKIEKEDLFKYSERELSYINMYCYRRGDVMYCSMDNDKFTNHSNEPNVYEDGPCTYAKVDIQSGEEILTDYRQLICEIHSFK